MSSSTHEIWWTALQALQSCTATVARGIVPVATLQATQFEHPSPAELDGNCERGS